MNNEDILIVEDGHQVQPREGNPCETSEPTLKAIDLFKTLIAKAGKAH